MITKLNKGWRNVLMLCAAAVVAVLVSSCRAPASDAGRYQWNIVSQESDSAQIYVTDTVTGEIAEWNRREKHGTSLIRHRFRYQIGMLFAKDGYGLKNWRERNVRNAKLLKNHSRSCRLKSRLPGQKPLTSACSWTRKMILFR